MASRCTLCHRLCLKTKLNPQPWQNRFTFYIFTRFKYLGVHSPYNPDLILPPKTFGFFSKLKERLAGRVHQSPGPLKNRTSFQCSTLYEATCFGVPICSAFVAQAASNLCGQWRDVLWRLVEVWWLYVHWFPFYNTCDRTFGLAFVSRRKQVRIRFGSLLSSNVAV